MADLRKLINGTCSWESREPQRCRTCETVTFHTEENWTEGRAGRGTGRWAVGGEVARTWIGVGDGHWLGVVRRRVHALPIGAGHQPRGGPGHRRRGEVVVNGHRLFVSWWCGGGRRGPGGRLVQSRSRHFTYGKTRRHHISNLMESSLARSPPPSSLTFYPTQRKPEEMTPVQLWPKARQGVHIFPRPKNDHLNQDSLSKDKR